MIRNESFRFRVLRNGADYAEIFPASAPTLRMNSTGEIKVSLQGTFYDKAVDSFGKETTINFLSDEIKPIMIIDGVEYPLGVLIPTTVTPSRDETKRTLEIQAYDRCWQVQDMKVEGFIHLASGTPYIDAIEGLLTSAGIATVIKTDSNAVLAEDRDDWSSGVSYLKVVNDLLKEINYKSLYFNETGSAMLQPILEPTATNISHTFTSKKTDVRLPQEVNIISMKPGIKRKQDTFNAPNVFIVVCSNPDKSGVMVAKSENTNLQSPLSIARRGRRIVTVISIDNIASQTELQKYADTIRNQSMYTGEVIDITTCLLPGFGVNDVVGISDDDVFGVCTETAWNMQLTTGGTMSHTLERTVVNLD